MPKQELMLNVLMWGLKTENDLDMNLLVVFASECAHTHTQSVLLIEASRRHGAEMVACLGFLTTGSVDDISQLSVLPLAEVVLFHTSSSFGGLHLRTPMAKNR